MAHMFRVDFLTNHANGMVEKGKVIVLAESHDMARDLVCQQLNLPSSRTRCDSSKIKPPCYPIESQQTYPTTKLSVRSQRDAPLAPTQRFHITVDASTHGQSEQQVMRKVGEELQARGAQTRLRHNIPMKIECETVNGSPSGPPSTMEKIEMLQPRAGRPLQGGQVRGK